MRRNSAGNIMPGRGNITPGRRRNSPAGAGSTAGQEYDRMAQSPRLKTLEDRHAALERQIVQEDTRPRPDPAELSRLKVEKLRLKDEIERLRREG
jgi:hypothetical protein